MKGSHDVGGAIRDGTRSGSKTCDGDSVASEMEVADDKEDPRNGAYELKRRRLVPFGVVISAELEDSTDTSIAPTPRFFVGDSTSNVVLEKCCKPIAVLDRLRGERLVEMKSSEVENET